MQPPIEVLCKSAPWSGDIELLVMRRNETSGAISYGDCVLMTALPEGAAIPRPTLSLERKQAQRLIDELWQCGLRPSEGSGSAGMLAATQDHLKDMRKLVAHHIGVSL